MSKLNNCIATILNILIKNIEIILPLFIVVNYNIYPFNLIFSRVFVLCAILILIFVKYPLDRNKDKPFLRYIDNILILSVIFIAIFSYFELNKFIRIAGMGTTPLYQMIIATYATFIIYESTRRVAGPILPAMSLILLGYAIHRGYSYSRIISEIFSYDGIFGLAFSLAVSVVFIFLLFGNLLNGAKFGDFLLKFGSALVGGTSGGPAKVAVISSGLFGSISGSAVANVVGTGTFTIPMMKKLGFSPTIAGAVEASASTGGQILPPIMAAAAFIMAEILMIPYLSVIKAAILPALAFYVCIYVSIDSYAKKIGIKGIPKKERPTIKDSMKEGGHLVIILFILIYLLFIRIEPLRAAFLTILFLFPLSYLNKKTRLNLTRTVDSLKQSTNGLLVVGSATATIGSIIACIALTGLGGKIANTIIGIGSGNLLLVLLLVMITCLLFGMALPTTASYLICVSIIAPTLIGLKIVPIAAHLFILYFAALSAITPPIALAAYVAAGIAESDMMKTAFQSVKLSLAAFFIPYILVYVPEMVLEGQRQSLFFIILFFVVVFPISLSWGIWGYTINRKSILLERLFYILISALLLLISIYGYLQYGIYITILWIIGTALFQFYYKKHPDEKLAFEKAGTS